MTLYLNINDLLYHSAASSEDAAAIKIPDDDTAGTASSEEKTAKVARERLDASSSDDYALEPGYDLENQINNRRPRIKKGLVGIWCCFCFAIAYIVVSSTTE